MSRPPNPNYLYSFLRSNYDISIEDWCEKVGITRGRAIHDWNRGSCSLRRTVRGQNKHPLQSTYHNMISRCYNKGIDNYLRYGARGIRVCSRWFYSFERFIEDVEEKPPLHTLDRIDNDGNYTPENCRWGTRSEQTANRRPKTGVTGHKYIYKDKRDGSFVVASYSLNETKSKYCGSYKTLEDALTYRNSSSWYSGDADA